MTEETVYNGSCHCGAVRFEVATDLAAVMSCNCSHCAARGLLLNFVTPERFTLLAGADALKTYQFNKKVIRHRFCATCGLEPFAEGTTPDGREMVAINVRCLDGVDPQSLTTTPIDGRSL